MATLNNLPQMSQSKFIQYLLVIIFMIYASSARAYYPFITDDTGTQGMGGNQLEFAYEFSKEHNDILNENGNSIGTGTGTSNLLGMTYTRGIAETVDIFIGSVRQINPVNGWQNSAIGVKWSFIGDQKQGWSAAIKPSVILPVSNSMQKNGLGNADTNVSISLIGSYVAEDYEAHVNTRYTSNNRPNNQVDDPQRRDLWSVSISPVLNLNANWKLGIDAGVQTNPGYNSRYQLFGGIGAVYAPIENLQVGFGMYAIPAINSNDNGWAYALTTGVTYQF